MKSCVAMTRSHVPSMSSLGKATRLSPQKATAAAASPTTTTAAIRRDCRSNSLTMSQPNDYSTWDKDQLIKRLHELDHAMNSAMQTPGAEAARTPTPGHKKKRTGDGNRGRPFDFSRHRARHVAIKVSYIGNAYHGFSSASSLKTAVGGDEGETATVASANAGAEARAVEDELFRALMTARLVPAIDRCGWSRCGRTDKGVSAFGQVVSLWIRTARPDASGTKSWGDVAALSSRAAPRAEAVDADLQDATQQIDNDESGGIPELSYLSILNRLLPADIRALAWAPVSESFDARFSCTSRKYYYYFDGSGLDVDAMRRAASLYVGTHDCRHICKVDPSKAGHPKFFERTIYESRIVPVREICQPSHMSPASDSHQIESHVGSTRMHDRMYVFVVRGRAFLWHQVRNMMAILFLVGRGHEAPEVVSQILDLTQHPPQSGRPQYEMAPDGPLVLAECVFPADAIQWRVHDDGCTDTGNASKPDKPHHRIDMHVVGQIEDQWRISAIRTLQLETLLREYSMAGAQADVSGHKRVGYVSLMKRKRCDSVEDILRKSRKAKGKQKQE